MLKNAIFLILLSMISGQVWANCDAILEETGKEETPTTSFIALLQKMIENQHMSVDQYQMLINSIETGKPKLPWGDEYLSTHSSIRLFGNLVSDYLTYWRAHPDYLDRETVVKMGRVNLKKWGREVVERNETKEETISLFVKMESVKISAGKLKVSDEYGEREVALLQDAEVQKYVVTQAMWVELMGENPSVFSEGEDEITLNINGKNVTMQPNHPVENINLYSAMVYANRLSEREGYKPVYDFSRVTNTTGAPKKGDYIVDGKIIINETDGYRLPTPEESEYLARGGTTTKYSFGDDEGLLDRYEWYHENSDNHAHPVGKKRPNPFGLYDVHGNIREWGGGDDQFGWMCRGSWNLPAGFLLSANRLRAKPEDRCMIVGFRLLRTLRHP